MVRVGRSTIRVAGATRTPEGHRQPRHRSRRVGLRAIQGCAGWARALAGFRLVRRAGKSVRGTRSGPSFSSVARNAGSTRPSRVDAAAGNARYRSNGTHHAAQGERGGTRDAGRVAPIEPTAWPRARRAAIRGADWVFLSPGRELGNARRPGADE